MEHCFAKAYTHFKLEDVSIFLPGVNFRQYRTFLAALISGSLPGQAVFKMKPAPTGTVLSSERLSNTNIYSTIRVIAYFKVFVMLASGGSAVVEHSPHHPKVKGLSPATAGDGREKMGKEFSIKPFF